MTKLLINDDCLSYMRTIPNDSVDCVITDPPFSSGTREANKTMRGQMVRSEREWFGSDNLSTEGFLYLMRQCALEWKRVLRGGSHVLIFIDWRMMGTLAQAIESADFRKQGVIVWNKTYFGLGSGFRNQHEMILHFSKDKPRVVNRKDCGNVIDCKPVRSGRHPTEKPVDLLKRLIDVVTKEGEVVLDPFSGSGTTLVAAQELGRGYIGIERQKEYCEIISDRLSAQLSLHTTMNITS